MFKQMVAISSLLAGVGSAGLAMYLQANPLALSHPARVDLNTYLYSAKTEPLPKPQAAPMAESEKPDVVLLPEVVVTRAHPSEPRAPTQSVGVAADPAARSRSNANSVPAVLDGEHDTTPAAAPRELQPCSKFRELGPMHVDDGVPSGVRGVRDLC